MLYLVLGLIGYFCFLLVIQSLFDLDDLWAGKAFIATIGILFGLAVLGLVYLLFMA